MTIPKNNGRKTDGKFAPGNRLGGKKPGARHRVTIAVEQMMAGEGEALARIAIDRALAGDTVALRLCLDRISAPRRDSPLSMALPPVRTVADAVEASAAVLAAVAAGEVTPDEGGRVMALLAAHRALIETAELEARVSALEAAA